MNTLNIKNKCIDCIHFSSEKLPAQTDVCEKLGVRPYQNAPRCFQAQPIHFIRSKLDIGQLGKSLRHLDYSQMITLANQLANAAELLNYGLKFGQPVYFNMSNKDYVDNYYKGYVVGCRTVKHKNSQDKLIFVASGLEFADKPEETYTNKAMLSLHAESLLTVKEWKEHYQYLVDNDLLEEPISGNSPRKLTYTQWIKAGKPDRSPTKYDAKYTPPTIDCELDTLLEEWEDLETSESVNLATKDDYSTLLDIPNKSERKAVIEYETYTDEDGNTVKVMKSSSSHTEATDLTSGFEKQIKRD